MKIFRQGHKKSLEQNKMKGLEKDEMKNLVGGSKTQTPMSFQKWDEVVKS